MENEIPSITSQLKIKFLEIISASTFHGISKIFTSRCLFSRTIWLILCLASYAYCSYCIMRNVIGYFEYPVVTNFETIYENEPDFPRIGICNVNKTLHNETLCHFNTKKCPLVVQRDGKYEKCIEFNPGAKANQSILKLKATGVASGLQLGMYTNDFYSGIQVFIFNHSENLIRKAIMVSPGMRTNLVINRVYEKRLGPPYSNCKHFASTSLQKQFHYFQMDCFFICFYKLVAEKCDKKKEFDRIADTFYTNTHFFEASVHNMTNSCDDDLVRKVKILFNEEGSNNVCRHSCPNECNSITYKISAYDFRLPDSEYLKGYVELNIYYESFYYTLMTQIPKTSFDEMFGSIGGLIGLFLGASLMSYVEIIELTCGLLHVIVVFYKNKRTEKKHTKSKD